MGRGDPLGHPDLRAIERCLDAVDVQGAQERLANLENVDEHADGVAFLTTRLLFLRQRLDLDGVVTRLRDVVERAGHFPEAAAMLYAAEHGRLALPSNAPPPSTPGLSAAQHSGPVPSVVSSPAVTPPGQPDRAAPAPERRDTPVWRPDAGGLRTAPAAAPERSLTPPWHPTSRPPPPAAGSPFHQPRRNYTPIQGFAAVSPQQVERTAPSGLPSIPRAPGIPEFEERPSPSYAPPAADPPEFDTLGRRSRLPPAAGRYSQRPRGAVESVRPSRPPPRDPGRPASPGERRAVSPRKTPAVRSGSPAPNTTASLVDVAAWIDDGQHRRAISALNRMGTPTPELSILRARALAGAGYTNEAFEVLTSVESAPLVQPETRAGCARLFVELGDPERGLRQAIEALEAEPEHSLIRITFALSAVRCARRRSDRPLLDKADRALATLSAHGGPRPALVHALKAAIEASRGDPQGAISMAQRALGLDGRSPDAVAAIAEASARLGHERDAVQAWRRLVELAPDEADAVGVRMARLGIPIGEVPASSDPAGLDIWPPVEGLLLDGNRRAVLESLEDAAQDHVTQMTKSASQSGFTALAHIASTFLTTAPVLCHFAPYDLSLWSLRRLEAALDVLYGEDRRPRLTTVEAPMVLLVGAYLGEALRLAFAGRWEGSTTQVDTTRVVTGNGTWHPFAIGERRLSQGARASIGEQLDGLLARPDGAAWGARQRSPVTPPTPWEPRSWPRPSEVENLGRAMKRSVVSLYCAKYAEGPFDRSMASLAAADSFLDLVAPVEASPDLESVWPHRVAVLVGAYVGEVMREQIGGDWIYGVDDARNAYDFRVILKDDAEATPVGHVLERVTGQRKTSLLDYVKTLARRSGR